MSETEFLKGKIKKIDKFENETLEDLCKRLYLGETDEPIEKWYTTYEDALSDLHHEKGVLRYVIVNDDVYRVISKQDYSGGDVFELTETSPGNFDYTLHYYNGGCCFSEALEYAFKNFKNKE